MPKLDATLAGTIRIGGDLEVVRRHLGEGELREHALAVVVGRVGVPGDLVAHAVDHPLAVDLLHRLDHVRVVAQDHVDIRRGEQGPGLLLLE